MSLEDEISNPIPLWILLGIPLFITIFVYLMSPGHIHDDSVPRTANSISYLDEAVQRYFDKYNKYPDPANDYTISYTGDKENPGLIDMLLEEGFINQDTLYIEDGVAVDYWSNPIYYRFPKGLKEIESRDFLRFRGPIIFSKGENSSEEARHWIMNNMVIELLLWIA